MTRALARLAVALAAAAWRIHVEDPLLRRHPLGGPRRYRARRRLRPLIRRPGSRELLDRAGLITGVLDLEEWLARIVTGTATPRGYRSRVFTRPTGNAFRYGDEDLEDTVDENV